MAWSVQGNIRGPSGREVEFRKTATHLQWRYVGEATWVNVIALVDITGPAGEGIEIAGQVATYVDLPDDLGPVDSGQGFLVEADGKLYIWSGTAFPADGAGVEFRGPQGLPGDPGDDATVSIGTTTTGEAGTPASVTNVGMPGAAVFNFVIPRGQQGGKGDTGDDGADATVSIGTTSTGAAGTNAAVTNTGTAGAAVLNFTIPRGDQGVQGNPGARGSQWYTGNGAPGTIVGAIAGDKYLDVSDGTVYDLS